MWKISALIREYSAAKYSPVRSLHKGSYVSFLYKHTKGMPDDRFRLKCEELFSSCLLSPVRFTLLADVPDSSLKDIWKQVVNVYVSIETHHCIPNTLHRREKCIYSCIWHWSNVYDEDFHWELLATGNSKGKSALANAFWSHISKRIQDKTNKQKVLVFRYVTELWTLCPITFQMCHHSDFI